MASAIDRNMLPTIRRRGVAWSGGFLAFFIFYAVAFPKGGIKVEGVPLTSGYILTVVLLIMAMLRSSSVTLPFDRLLAFLPCLLLGLWSVVAVQNNGTDSVGFTISYFVSVLYLPIFGLLVFSPLILDDHNQRIERAFIWAVRFIVVYGVFLFFYKQVTGKWIQIPFITVNVADVGQLDDKMINRGGIFKLISTYNNGNIFGVSLAIMAPLYLRLEPRKVFEWALYAAMFLTLSRTAWIAAVLIMFLRTLAKGARPIVLLYLAVGLLVAGTVIVSLLSFLGRDMSFVFDSDLGGRINQFDVLSDMRVIPEGQVSALPEIAYLGMLKYFGIPGLLLFIAHLLVPALLLRLEGVRLLSLTPATACLQGLLVYAVLAGADAAFSFIPVMMIFWMVAGWGFWYAHRQTWQMKGVREASR